MKKILLYLFISLNLNAFGNALTIKINLGSAPWTGLSTNAAFFFDVPISVTLTIVGVTALIINYFAYKQASLKRSFFNLLFLLSFSYLVDFWYYLIPDITIDAYLIRLLLNVFGIVFIAAGVSIYLRLNVVLHPVDELLQVFRLQVFRGNVVKAQVTSLSIPLIGSLIFWWLSGNLYAVNVATLVSFFFMGWFIVFFDKYLFPSIKLNAKITTTPN
ncbi:YczE/YyaS/YitT family protein [Brochothrix campestris]|uniref:YczE/YyaS/YitT family protein n=1 Tax=Brochothrix campestris TaxID=2757 RepID=UPI0038D08A85